MSKRSSPRFITTASTGMGKPSPSTPPIFPVAMKPFIAVVVLQLAEERRLSLDARLPALLPVNVVRRFHDSAQISVRMLLDHRSGIPEWDTPDIDDQIAHHPAKIWTIREKLDLAAAHPPVFAPGTSYKYSNTDYNLLGLIIERVTGHSWRHEVSRRVIGPPGLSGTSLPAPGHRSLPNPYAHAYAEVDGKRVDQTRVDPSVAGAAGGEALVTTVQDLAASSMRYSKASCSATAPRYGRCWPSPRHPTKAARSATAWESNGASSPAASS